MRRFLGFAILLVAVSASAQAVSPLVVECGKKCSGSFTVTNDGVQPLAVTVEPYTFGLAPDGHTLFKPLASTAQVDMSQTSARVGPHSEHEFDYSVRCSEDPCLVALVTGMVVGHTPQGIAIRLVIPHIVYQCDKAKGCRAAARTAAGLKD